MKTAKDYKVTFPYGATDGTYYGVTARSKPTYIGSYHRGDDRAMPQGTPVVVNGVQIGLSGQTGAADGPHLHVGRFVNSLDTNPQGGFSFKNAVVTEIGEDDVNGKYVRVQADGASWVYLHLSKQTAKVGQKLVAPKPVAKPEYIVVKFGWGLSLIAKAAKMKDWWLPTAWIRISKLNGYGVNWLKMNNALKPNQKVRVK